MTHKETEKTGYFAPHGSLAHFEVMARLQRVARDRDLASRAVVATALGFEHRIQFTDDTPEGAVRDQIIKSYEGRFIGHSVVPNDRAVAQGVLYFLSKEEILRAGLWNSLELGWHEPTIAMVCANDEVVPAAIHFLAPGQSSLPYHVTQSMVTTTDEYGSITSHSLPTEFNESKIPMGLSVTVAQAEFVSHLPIDA